MVTVAQIAGVIRIAQYYGDHHPPHVHAIQGNNEAGIEIAPSLQMIFGHLKPGALQDVQDWARDRRAALALNWVDALAQEPLRRIK